MGVFAAFVVKPLYTILLLLLLYMIWKLPGKTYRILKWGVFIFWAGEMSCFFNFLAGEESLFFESMHGFGMVIGVGFMIWSLLLIIDEKLIFFSPANKPCGMIRFCGSCIKKNADLCRFLGLFSVVSAFLALISLIPLFGPFRSIKQVIKIFGDPVLYTISNFEQTLDIRIYPLLAFGLLAWSAWVVYKQPTHEAFRKAKPFFSFGLGFLSFSLLRFLFIHAFHSRMIWNVFWEETTELMLVCFILWALWYFRQSLGLTLVKLSYFPILKKEE